jgi:hypothetical protein
MPHKEMVSVASALAAFGHQSARDVVKSQSLASTGRASMKSMFLAALGMIGLAHSALAQNEVVQSHRQIGGWEFMRYVGPGGNRAVRCDGERNFPSGNFLRFSAIPAREGGYTFRVTFSGPQVRLESLGASFPIAYWVDDESLAKPTTATAGPAGVASFTEGNDEPGSQDAWSNGRNFNIRVGGNVLSFPLQGTNAVFRALHTCADSP